MAQGEIIEMSQRLCIGLIQPSKTLISLLNSIGVWYEEVDLSSKLVGKYSLLIIDQIKPDNALETNIDLFLKSGGALLEISSKPLFYPSSVTKKYSKSIYNSKSDTEFDRITHLDIYDSWTSFNSDILSGLVDFKFDSQRKAGFIGLDLKNIADDLKYIRKRFLSTVGVHPDELANKLGRDSLSDIIELSIQRLFHIQELPFIKKWSSPGKTPIFGFRIDSDYGTKESLSKIYTLLDKHSIKGSWFLHVKAHEKWLDWFKSLNNQELALHGYKHGTSSSLDKISANISKGLDLLAKQNIHPQGFCAPYGIWNRQLKTAIKDFNFDYTSEFTSGYDCLPFKNQESENIQIPIHPICTGSLSRRRYTIDEMRLYFMDVYRQKISLFKSVLFYHHPLQNGIELFDEIFERSVSDSLTNLTFAEYASFWKKRARLDYSVVKSNGQYHINSNDDSLFLYISNSPDQFTLLSSGSQKTSDELNPTFKYQSASLPSLTELKKLHSNRLRMLKTSFNDWRNRYRL